MKIHFIFNNHKLGVGVLKWEPHIELPNNIYPDNIQDLFGEGPLSIELVSGNGDCNIQEDVEGMLPLLKVEKLTYEDLTEDDLNDLAERVAVKVIQKRFDDKKYITLE